MTLFSNIRQLIKRRPALGAGGHAQWPFYRGKYEVVDATAPVVVTTLGNDKLADELASLQPPGLCLVCPLTGGRAEIEKFVHTLTGNLSIRHLLCVGEEPRNPTTLAALQALFGAGDALDAVGVSKIRLGGADVAGLRKQVQFTDMHGCVDIDKIAARVRELSSNTKNNMAGFVPPGADSTQDEQRIIAADNVTHDLISDKAGNFKLSVSDRCIVVEHYNSKDELLRVVEGTSARSICLTLIRNGWISKLDHAAYLGRELMRAELALQNGVEFTPDAGRNVSVG